MNLKKYLRQMAENDEKNQLTEEDKQFCSQLAEIQPSGAAVKKTNYTLFATIALAFAICLALAITLPIVLKKPVDDIFYREENIKSEACLLEDVNANTQFFMFAELDNSVLESILSYDSISNDKLYYTISYSTVISRFSLLVNINSNYTPDFELNEDLSNTQLAQYTVYYKSEVIDGFSGSEVKYTGYITKETETVYIDYTQLIDVGEQAFFDDIQNVLKVK